MLLNISHYSFQTLLNPVEISHELKHLKQNEAPSLRGTILLAREGFNMNLAAQPEDISRFLEKAFEILNPPDKRIRKSFSQTCPFRRFEVKVKKEIITSNAPDIEVNKLRGQELSTYKFKEILENPSGWLLLDIRNHFEYEWGTFMGAVSPQMKTFKNFATFADKLSMNYPKEQKIAMFCTGGIRCEKASAQLRQLGFQQLYQLGGGILRYFEEQGTTHFKGRCFVFDSRESLDPVLAPSPKDA